MYGIPLNFYLTERLFLYVVSPIHQPAYLLERIYNFFRPFGDSLERFSKSRFRTCKGKAWTFLPENSGIHHALIHDANYKDGRSESIIDSVKEMKKDEFIGLYKRFFTKETCCSINIRISAGGASDQARCNSGSYTPNGSGGKHQNHKEKKVPAKADSSEDDSSDEETPKKPEEPKKRAAEAESSRKPTSNKKAKFVTPQKTETKAGKNSGEASKSPKSAGAFGCKTFNRSFTSEMGLQSHTKAKHSAAA